MRIQENNKIIQIYLTKEEREDLEIKKKIENLKKSNKVILFVSGDNDVKEVLRKIICIMKNNF